MAKAGSAVALCCVVLLAGCGFLGQRPACNIDVQLSLSDSDETVSATLAVLARRITEMGGDVAAQTRDGDRITFAVDNCPSEREPLRRLLLSPGKFRLGLKDRPETGLTEADVAEANMALDFVDQKPVVAFRLTPDGTSRFAGMTTQAVGHALQLKWDRKVISEPVIAEPITGGRGQIGPFSADEALAVALALRSGPLPIGIRRVEIRNPANAK